MSKHVQIARADRSPLNPKRWLLSLGCGHEEWVTQGKRPEGTRICSQCPGARERKRKAGTP